MKRILLPLLFQMFINLTYSQIVNESVNFNNPNDLTDHFYGFQSLTQISTGGILNTGSLQTPDSNNWGNDNSIYCSKYSGLNTNSYQTRILFYYADSIINPNSFDRAASIWLSPHTDPNHYIIATLGHNKKLELLTYFSADYSPFLTMASSASWYSLNLNVTFSNDSAVMHLELVDMGPDGLGSLPVYLGDANASVYDTVLTRDNAIQVSITGARYGGAIYIDDFSYSGIKSADSCLTSNINNPNAISEIKFSVDNNNLIIRGDELKGKYFEIFNMSGKKITDGIFNDDFNQIDISKISDGIYLLNVYEGSKHSYRKFSLVKQ